MSIFTTKVNGQKVTVVARNVAYVTENSEGRGVITFTNGDSIDTQVGYDSIRRNVAKALDGAKDAAE
ncbi:gp27 [Escherichia phage N4]|uniref:Gp27 n=1 Tax=Enterobacteria phage N4 TaxID=2886925 RepID=A0MZB7_BPN4|nr:gp27 [Escherichia phage N4]ABK54396.1 gp27 [Escherichia phage N4]